MKMPKIECNECGHKQKNNPYYDDWFCSKCKTHWVLDEVKFAKSQEKGK